MINESLKNAFKEMWKKNLNLLDISKSDLNSHISNDHPCYYAESASIGGPASSAVKLNSSAGDSNTPVYFSGGRPVACTSLDLNTSGNAATATALTTSAGSATNPIYFSEGKPAACTYTLSKSVPSDAKFTDTTYTSLKNPYALTIQGNGTTLTNGTYDGSAAKTVNITPASIGAAASSHTHDNMYYTESEIDNYNLITTSEIDNICQIPTANIAVDNRDCSSDISFEEARSYIENCGRLYVFVEGTDHYEKYIN